MSYFNTLNSFQDSASAIQSHAQDVANESASAGKNIVDEKFSHISDILGKTGGDLGSFGAAFHVSRKVYKKAKALGQAAKDAKQKLTNLVKPENPENPEGGGEGEKDDGSTKNGEEDSKVGPEGDDTVRPPNPQAEQTEPPPLDDAKAPATVEAEPATVEPAPAAPATVEPAPAPAPAQTTTGQVAVEDQAPLVRGEQGNTATTDGPSRDPNAEFNDGPTMDAPRSTGVETGGGDGPLSSLTGGAEDSNSILSNMTDTLGDVANAVKSGVQKAGSAIADSVTSTISEMGTVSGALDAVGPIGEVLGAGVGIADLFYGLLSKSSENSEEEEAETSAKDAITQSGGIDVKNVIHSGSIGGSVGTMV
jgi:hypothetical protein